MYNTDSSSTAFPELPNSSTNTSPEARYLDTNSIEFIEFEKKKLSLQHGFLGVFFGASLNAPLNIAGLVLVLLIVPGIVLVFFDGKISVIEYWKQISPAVTLILGYVLASKTSS
jgi:hypothetical protein